MTATAPLEAPDKPSRVRRRLPRRWLWFTALLTIPLLAIGAWVIWSLVKENPVGFAPTVDAASPISGTDQLQFTVDARSRREWVFFNFSAGTVVTTTQEALDWDIAFRRNDLLTNGGETNPAGPGEAANLGDLPLARAVLPSAGFASDVRHEDRGLENPNLHKWYSYNWTTHIVSSRGHTYAVRTASGEAVLMTFLSYYCDDQSAGCVTFRYRLVGRE